MKIFRILLQMLGEFINALRKKRHLDVRRTGVLLVARYVLDGRGLLLRG